MIDKKIYGSLQFDTIINEIKRKAIGEYSKEQIENLRLDTQLPVVRIKQQETKEARGLVDSGQHMPFMGLTQIKRLKEQIDKGLILTAGELLEVADFLRSNRMIRLFFEKNSYQAPLLYDYSQSMITFEKIEDRVYQTIRNGQVDDLASTRLKKIRQKIRETDKAIEEKLQKFIRNSTNKSMLQEAMVIKKGEYYTVPVKSSYKNKIAGTIIEESNKGQTVYVEPTVITRLSETLMWLRADESAEEYQLLAELSGMISEESIVIDNAIESVTAFDIIFARARYSREIDGITPKLNKSEYINLIDGRHPLLSNEAVPLNVTLGKDFRGLVITGANAGGKTVVLKTLGLFTLMAMMGVQIPAKKGSTLAVMDHIFVDIGDQQSMENALSTFSGHINNISTILGQVSRHSLILLDEIGSGTEPNEGAALAIAILEDMYQKGALIVATTHYGEIKDFSKQHQDFTPAAMTFDKESLTPLYQLVIGAVGDSQALWIAQKMKLPSKVIDKATKYMSEKDYELSKKEFKQIEEVKKDKKDEEIIYAVGDKVWLNEIKKDALIYLDDKTSELTVFLDGEQMKVLRKRVTLMQSASDLYPEGYDLNQLFTSYSDRKLEHDLNRGSKKALKALNKKK